MRIDLQVAGASPAQIEKYKQIFTVLIEKGGEGSSVAAPIAKKILEEWFSK